MPGIDYSKFDSIEDSDEESGAKPGKPGAAVRKGPQQVAEGATGGGSRPSFPPRTAAAAPAGTAAPPRAPGRPGAGGDKLLEPVGLDASLKIVTGPADAELEHLASQLERLGGAGQGRAAAAPAEPPKPGEPQRLCMRADGKKKIHTTYPDGGEMVEEFDERTDVLLLRKVRKATTLGKESEWVYEVGQAPEASFDPHTDLMRASAANPIFLRKDTPEHFQWRIRNLPYPADVYSVTVDHEKQEVVVRTSNKKYYKRIGVPDLARVGLKLQDNSLSWKHQHNTLIISYVRPPEVAEQEQRALREAERSALTL